jgi:hypothetical protein
MIHIQILGANRGVWVLCLEIYGEDHVFLHAYRTVLDFILSKLNFFCEYVKGLRITILEEEKSDDLLVYKLFLCHTFSIFVNKAHKLVVHWDH